MIELPILTIRQWIVIFGISGNIIAFMTFLFPVPIFYRIVKNECTEEYDLIPTLVGLFHAMLRIYYGIDKPGSLYLISMNSASSLIQLTCIAIYIAYAPKEARVRTLRILVLFHLGGVTLIAVCCHYLVKGSHNKARVIGCICLAANMGVFVPRWTIMKRVVSTKSVDCMPFFLLFLLTLNSVAWFFYGLYDDDFYVYVPNAIGFALGIVQMVLYFIYKYCSKNVAQEQKVRHQQREMNTVNASVS